MAAEERPGFRDRLWRVGLQGAYRVLLGYWFLRRPRSLGVHVAVWSGGRVLLMRNSYKSQYGLPCGGLNWGEVCLSAAARELREEVGVHVPAHRLRRAVELSSTEEFKLDRGIFYEVELDPQPPVRADGREVVWAAFLSPEEARALPLTDLVRQYFDWRGR